MEEPILQFFEYKHLRQELWAISAPFCILASQIMQRLPRNPERTVALRKLLEAKDAAVRARLYREPQSTADMQSTADPLAAGSKIG